MIDPPATARRVGSNRPGHDPAVLTAGHRVAILTAFLSAMTAAGARAQSSADWPHYGRDPGGRRYAPVAQIDRDNVGRLEVAWTYRTGEAGLDPDGGGDPSLEATPIVVDGTMYIGTPLGRVIALDPASGAERWVFDPGVDPHGGYGDFTNRGVSTWLDPAADPGAACRRRIYIATVDARLIALDAATGDPCAEFGRAGTVDLRRGLRVAPFQPPAYQVTSPPAVIGDLVITGSAVADNSRRAPASGEIRAFDARTGALRWSWDPIPQDPADPAYATWGRGSPQRTGAANAWSVMVTDPERDLLFVPTSSPAPDYYGVDRSGANRYASSIVALRASSGRVVWHFQTVHHDLWDYDNASPPALATIERDGRRIPAVVQATKTGMLFVLHRETGAPLFPVEERPVPRSAIPGEEAWPTQPFTATTPPLSPHRFDAGDAWGPTPEDRAACREMMGGLRNEGIFTPPSLEGTFVLPSNIGGAHWGGLAVDERRAIAVVPVNRIAAMVQLIPRERFDPEEARRESDRLGYEYNRMEDTPYVLRRRLLLGPSGLPCTPPPFGSLVAVNLSTGDILWDVPLGRLGPPGEAGGAAGSPNLGGPLATAGGLIFIAATLDRSFRAFDIETGRELWRAALPAGGKATPMTYMANGRQYVVIAAGGGGQFGEGDSIVAFALPDRP